MLIDGDRIKPFKHVVISFREQIPQIKGMGRVVVLDK